MSEWKTVRLGDVCEIARGGSPRPINEYITTDENGINWIKIGDTSSDSKYIERTEQKIKPEGMKKSRYVHSGDFILSNSMSFGRPYILKIDGCIHDGWLVLQNIQNDIDKDYLYFVLSSPSAYHQFERMAVGGVVNNLNSDKVKELIFPLPPLEKQKQIAKILDKCNILIIKHKQMVEKYDALIKSRFIEMFGDPVENPKQWNIEKLKSLTSKIGSGATPKGGRESYISEGISLVRSMNVYKGFFEYEGLAHITEAQAKELDNVTLQENDVLLNITGASVARCCILPKDVLPARVNQHVSILRTTEKINPVYLSNLLISDTEQRVLLGIGGAGGATREAITKTELESLDIPVPPLELQQQFATFVQQIDKSKFAVQKSLEKAETLYKSLMQEYFG